MKEIEVIDRAVQGETEIARVLGFREVHQGIEPHLKTMRKTPWKPNRRRM